MQQKLDQLRKQVVQLHGNYTKILPITIEMISIAKNSFGSASVEYAVALNDLGGVYRHLGRYTEARDSFQQALDILGNKLGMMDPNYATTLNNMAGLLRLMNQYEQSEQLFQAVIAIYQQTLGEKHFLTLSAFNNLGLLYQDMQRYDEAKKLHEKCLNLLEGQKKEHPIAYGTTLNNLVSLYEKMGDLDRALALVESVSEVYKQNLGNEHPLYANALNNHAALCFQNGDLLGAQALFTQAKDINLKMFGSDSEIYKTTINNLDIIEQRLGYAHKKYSTLVGNSPTSNITPASSQLNSVRGYGMQQSKDYFDKLCQPILSLALPEQIGRMAIGLVGEGSECYGFDDQISQDHDFGQRVIVWIPQDDFASLAPKIQTILDNLPQDSSNRVQTQTGLKGSVKSTACSIESFYAKFTGLFHPPETLKEWLAIPEHHLATATNGEVFFDVLGQFTAYRNHLLNFYPEDVCLKKMTARCMKIAQAGQYNFSRCLKRGENVAASLAAAEFIDAGISMVFLLNKRYQPFYKWMHRALKELPILGQYSYQLFNNFVSASPEKQVILIEEFCAKIIEQLTQCNLTSSRSDFLLDHGSQIMQRIQDQQLKNSNPWVESQ